MKLKLNKILLSAINLLFLVVVFQPITTAQSLIPSFGNARSGTSGFQFTKISVDPRNAGMGFSNVADAKDASSLYWNPALAAQADQSEIMLAHTAYFADISMEYLALIHKYKSFTFGGSLHYLNSGEMNETTEFDQWGTGRTFRTVHMAAGLTASHKITELFSYGLTIKYLMEKIEEVQVNSAAIDFGFFYKVSDTGLRFAVSMSNFGFDATPSGETTRPSLEGDIAEKEFEDISLPTRFIIAAAYDVYEGENIDVMLTGQIANPSDNAEQFSLGGELTYLNRFFIRTGYQFGYREVQLPSLGAGISFPLGENKLFADYSYSPYERLGTLHRLALRFTF